MGELVYGGLEIDSCWEWDVVILEMYVCISVDVFFGGDVVIGFYFLYIWWYVGFICCLDMVIFD